MKLADLSEELRACQFGDARLKKRQQTPIQHKESYRWVDGIKTAELAATACPETTCVFVSDSESDIAWRLSA